MMTVERFVRRTRIPASAEDVFHWHARPGALERLTPPWEPVEVLERTGGIEDGARVVLGVGMGPLRLRWVSEHRDYEEGRQFRDVPSIRAICALGAHAPGRARWAGRSLSRG